VACEAADIKTEKQITREHIYWKKFYEANPQYNICPDTVIIDPGLGPHV
jgi:hypothetical protein